MAKFSDVYPDYMEFDVDAEIKVGKPRGPSHTKVLYRGRDRLTFTPSSDGSNGVVRCDRERRIEFLFSPANAKARTPRCTFTPIAITFTRSGGTVGRIVHQFHYDFVSKAQVKSTNKIDRGPGSNLVWSVRLLDLNGEEITQWDNCFVQRHTCTTSSSKSVRNDDHPKDHLSWDVLTERLALVEFWPTHGGYWYEFC